MSRSACPPAARKSDLPSIPISSSVSRQSATKPGQITSTRRARCRASSPSTGAVYGFSHSARPKRDWNASCHAPVRELELRREEPRRLLALAVVGVAPVERALRQAVEAHQQRRRAGRSRASTRGRARRARGCRRDGRGSAARRAARATLRVFASVAATRSSGGRRGARRVLGIERQHEQPFAAARSSASSSTDGIDGSP